MLTSVLRIFVCLTVLACFSNSRLQAQHCKFFTIDYSDSLVVDKTKKILFNNISLTNPRNKRVNLQLKVAIPKGWNILKGKEYIDKTQTLNFEPFETKIIPICLLQTPGLSADWTSMKMTVSLFDLHNDEHVYFSRMRVKPSPSFAIRRVSDDIYLVNGGKSNQLNFITHLKNTGNVSDDFAVYYRCRGLDILDSFRIALAPGQDTTLQFTPEIKENLINNLYDERFNVTVVNNSKASKAIYYSIVRSTESVKVHSSRYSSIPLSIEGGYMSFGNRYSYFGAISGRYNSGDHNLTFSYRSKQFGTFFASYLPHVFSVSYKYRNLRLAFGQFNGPREFITMGQGISAAVTLNGIETGITAIKHFNIPGNDFVKNDNITSYVKYKIKNVKVLTNVIYNTNQFFNQDNYLVTNDFQYQLGKKLRVLAKLSAGIDHFKDNGTESWAAPGWAASYDLGYHGKNMEIFSRIDYNSATIPGIYKGWRSQFHEARILRDNKYAGLFYLSNFFRQNLLRDSIFNSDFLQNNTTKYGVSLGYTENRNTINVKLGKISQQGQLNVYELDNAAFADIYLSLRHGRFNSILINSMNAFKPANTTSEIFVTSTSVNLNTRHGGIFGNYNRIPLRTDQNTTSRTIYRETINGGPYLRFRLLQSKITGSVRYNISRSFHEEYVMSGVGGDLSYYSNKAGVNLSLSTFYPFQERSIAGLPVQDMKYLFISLRKSFELPILTHRKYFTLKAILFRDENANGIKDDKEEYIKNAHLIIDGGGKHLVTTNEQGEVYLKHTTPGTYTINCLKVSSGLIATNGPVQAVEVVSNTSYFIPFRKGKLLKGNLSVKHDSLSNTVLTPEHIRVIATDTAGQEFSTLTDEAGDFFLYVAPGDYVVRINQQIFDGSGFRLLRNNFSADLTDKDETSVQFVVEQKKRKIIFLDKK